MCPTTENIPYVASVGQNIHLKCVICVYVEVIW